MMNYFFQAVSEMSSEILAKYGEFMPEEIRQGGPEKIREVLKEQCKEINFQYYLDMAAIEDRPGLLFPYKTISNSKF